MVPSWRSADRAHERPSSRTVHTTRSTPESIAIERRALVAVLATLVVIVVANNSAGSLAQPAIAREFAAGPADVGWVVFGFGMAFAVATALWGGIARRAGIGPSLATGVLLFSGASAVAAIAPSLPVLIAARIVQGLGAGAIPTLATSAISLRFEGPDRARAIGAVVAAVGLGMGLGPILGGVALELFDWHGPVAFGVIAAPAALVLAREGSDRGQASGFDLRGAALVAVAVVALVYTLNRLPVTGLAEPTIVAIVLLALAIPLIAHRSIREDAFVPRRIVTDPTYTRVVFLGAVGMSAFLGTLVLVPIAAAGAHELDGIRLGLLILPLAVAGGITSLQNARIQMRIGRRATTVVSLLATASAALAVGLVGADADPVVMAIALLPLGIGFGLLQAPLVNEVTIAFGDADRPLAVGLYNLVFFLGGAVGAAITTALVQAGVELPLFDGRSVPGFSTAQVLLAIGPLVAIGVIVVRGRGGSGHPSSRPLRGLDPRA